MNDEEEIGYANEADIVQLTRLNNGDVLLILGKDGDDEPWVSEFSLEAFASFISAGLEIMAGRRDDAAFAAIDPGALVGEA